MKAIASVLEHALARAFPEYTPEERARYVAERTAELAYRTPHVITWQDFLWPTHCDDYCRFLQEVGKPDILALASDIPGQSLLKAHLLDPNDQEQAQELWDALRPDSPLTTRQVYTLGMYLFQCRTCQQYTLLWDCE